MPRGVQLTGRAGLNRKGSTRGLNSLWESCDHLPLASCFEMLRMTEFLYSEIFRVSEKGCLMKFLAI
jgi:hypothetical protein